jgi:thiol-disulfide isomerase/thioredoxin
MSPGGLERRSAASATTRLWLIAHVLTISLVAAAQASDSPHRELRLHFRLPAGMTLPADFRPQVYAESDRDQARLMWQPEFRRDGLRHANLLTVHATGSGEFEVRLLHPEQPFYVAIHAPGFLRFFERGPFQWSQIKNGRLEIDVEKPATLEVHFNPGQEKPEKLPFDGQVLHIIRRAEGAESYNVFVDQDLPFKGFARISDLAAGDYLVGVETRPKPGVKDDPRTTRSPVNPGAYVEKRKVTLRPGQSVPVSFRYVPFDLNVFRGNRTAAVRLLHPDGKPAASKPIWVGYFDAHYGAVPVFDGSVPAAGEIVLKDITDRVPEIMAGAPYFIFVGNRCLGRFGFSKKSGVERFTFPLWPDANDLAPDAELIAVTDGKPIKLSSLRGKVVWIDFWATWCKPCQPAMKELDQLATDEPARWKDRVVLVPVSIDEQPELVTRHLAQRGWTHLEHFWSGPSKINGFQSPAARLFVVDGVPTSFLIGPDGHILWRGSPIPEPGGKSMKDRIAEALGR